MSQPADLENEKIGNGRKSTLTPAMRTPVATKVTQSSQLRRRKPTIWASKPCQFSRPKLLDRLTFIFVFVFPTPFSSWPP